MCKRAAQERRNTNTKAQQFDMAGHGKADEFAKDGAAADGGNWQRH